MKKESRRMFNYLIIPNFAHEVNKTTQNAE